ncbi:CbiQ family ECF transporter T component [Paracoccus simplex]|uniref:CbiQ family ECF transporter T component n=1 Tax=Paracoccus simplex TaxID=2086346 RepID=A0ABV7RVA9_9RHOB
MISLSSPIRTRAHGWPAAAKLAALCLASTALFAVEALWFQCAALGLALALYALPGPVFLRAGLAALRIVLPFVGLVLVWHALSGSPAEGVFLALRMATAVALANLVTMTTSLEDLTDVVRALGRPLQRLGLPMHLLETAIPLVIRFTPVLIQKAGALVEAWRARSARRPGPQLVLPLALLALDDADHVAEALRARGGPLR